MAQHGPEGCVVERLAELEMVSDRMAEPQCAVCGAITHLQGVCAACKKVWYCSKEHQKVHWPVHLTNCRGHKRRSAALSKSPHPSSSRDFQLPVSVELALESLLMQPCCPWSKETAIVHFHKLAQLVADGLHHRGFVRLNSFHGADISAQLSKSIRDLHSMNPSLFRAGENAVRGGQSTASNRAQDIRGDAVFWHKPGTSKTSSDLLIDFHLAAVDMLMSIYMNSDTCRDNYPDMKMTSKSPAMISHYPAQGSGYLQHVDNPPSLRDGRRLTFIYYLNSDWDMTRDGGCLCVSPGNAAPQQEHVLPPELDSVVIFWSDERTPHRVQPCRRRDRYAITVWLFDQLERKTHLERQQQRAMNALRSLAMQGKIKATDLERALKDSKHRRELNLQLQQHQHLQLQQHEEQLKQQLRKSSPTTDETVVDTNPS